MPLEDDPYPSTDEESNSEDTFQEEQDISVPPTSLKSRKKLQRSSFQHILGTFWSQTQTRQLEHRMSLPEITPLLPHSRSTSSETGSPTPRFRRKIVPEGTMMIVYPIASFTRSTPLQFSSDLPYSLQDMIPAPLYRSHIHELNQVLEEAHSKKTWLYKSVGGVWIITILSLLMTSWVVALFYEWYWTSGIMTLLSVGLILLKPLLTRLWMSQVLKSIESHTCKMVEEWNARAPSFLHFHLVLGPALSPDHPDVEQGSTTELHILLLDSPRNKTMDWDDPPTVSRRDTLVNTTDTGSIETLISL